ANAARHAAGQRHVAVVAQDRQAGDRDAVCGIPRGGADDGDRAAIAVHFAGAVTVADQGDADGGAVAGDVDVATAAGDGAVVAELDRHGAEFPAVANQLDRAAFAVDRSVHELAVAVGTAAVDDDVATGAVEAAVEANARIAAGALQQD